MLFHQKPEPKVWELRIAGVLFVVFFGLVGLLIDYAFDARVLAVTVWISVGGIGLFYYVVPASQRMIYGGWLAVVSPLGSLLSHAIFLVTYYLVITPIGLIMRLFRYDPLCRRIDKASTTYWMKHPTAEKPRRYFQQF